MQPSKSFRSRGLTRWTPGCLLRAGQQYACIFRRRQRRRTRFATCRSGGSLRHFYERDDTPLCRSGLAWNDLAGELGLKDTATHIYLMERVLSAEGETRPLLRILHDLADRLAIPDYFPWQDQEDYLNALLVPQQTR